jgi:potassium-transporting ATPase ATP-binding subunit
MEHTIKKSVFSDSKIIKKAVVNSFRKLSPGIQLRNPVMFIVYIGAIYTSAVVVYDCAAAAFHPLNLHITIWLWFTVLFANFAEAVAEGQGKARADSLRKSRVLSMARLLDGTKEKSVPAAQLKRGDIVVCEANDIIPGDGEVIEGIASVDESAITGESAPVIRESGGDRSAVTAGTKVISDRIVIRITSEQGNTFLDRMITLIEGSVRQKTPNEMAMVILLSGLTIIFLLAVMTLYSYSSYSAHESGQALSSIVSITTLIALLVCLIPTTIGGLLSAIGISGIDRLLSRNVIATSGRAIEAAGDIDVLLLDKTGTITLGNRMASEMLPIQGVDGFRLADAAQISSLSDETPEGRSIVVFAKEKFNIRGREITNHEGKFIPFSASTRMSGVDIKDDKGADRKIRKGSADAIERFVKEQGGTFPGDARVIVESIAKKGGTPIVVAENKQVLGVIFLKDIVKGGIIERFARLRKMGIRTVMITGDNPVTAAAIAAESGVDDFIAEAKPETKLARIREEQARGRLVAMIGDGTNDAPALAQADVGVAMNTGTQTAREAGNMVDLDSNPTKLIEIVEIGKQLLMTRGSLTTFSIANDVAKYFAILPALFFSLYAANGGKGPLAMLNVMNLSSPSSAILSAIIFNALIIVALIPLALKGIAYRPEGANKVLFRNLMIYGVGGLIVPFIGIKLIDLLISVMGIV